jgi:septal ring factor EnvC (AmiA/AmiB activator)
MTTPDDGTTLATILTVVTEMNRNVESTQRQMGTIIGRLNTVDSQLNTIDNKLSKIDNRLDTLDKQVQRLDGQVEFLGTHLGNQILTLAANQGALTQRMDNLELVMVTEFQKMREHVTETMRQHIELQHPNGDA